MSRTLQEKVDMVFIFGASGNNYHETMRRFNENHPERPVSRTYLRQLITKFRETGSVTDAKRSGRPPLSEEVDFEVLCTVVENPQTSSRQIADNIGVSQRKAITTLKKHKFHPYKIMLHHALNEDDPDRRLQFCETMDRLIIANPTTVNNICFSDESTFYVNGLVNRHNCRYWDNSNPHVHREHHTQYPQKVNVWAGLFGNHVIGPLFIDGNLNGESYLHMLQNNIHPLIENTIRTNGGEFNREEVRFQQDGAPPHYDVNVRGYLNVHFREKWIGRRGAIEWPARSPDLNPLDFFLWGHLKSVIYCTPVACVEDLRNRITEACRKVTPEILTRVRSEFVNRLYYCQEVTGNQFEHLLQ